MNKKDKKPLSQQFQKASEDMINKTDNKKLIYSILGLGAAAVPYSTTLSLVILSTPLIYSLLSFATFGIGVALEHREIQNKPS